MFTEYTICPYTGLRSFTEEESLYFKGREDHIQQATEQLERNKFLMLTGASGDGKSSLVYAGIIPNARAGFLKSKYTQWCVADFRPERKPFKNLAKVVARQLGIENPNIVESELHHGFSALADLYKNSKRFVDAESVAWNSADDIGKAKLKREAANLIILVDQFEEFFTNPENYHSGVPSRDSNLVLNVLLETARIALEENLPIYIVFTMRSDYIGQCAAFRSLPEYIGFSQFFVPRLNRSQLSQVIEEPATLSGNRISRRLTERLIHDIAEGVDQLPILQHALNQIWHSANKGSEEMDLIHYAMVGGMPSSELPDEQVNRFKEWFGVLPEKIKPFYREPNLKNVLDTHANKLYESAGEQFRNKTGRELSDDIAKAIVKTAFMCLTKIDQSRAVRNRMTLQEITRILGRPEISTKDVGAVLDIFREPGNTFIRPFYMDESEYSALVEADVLDITHESLIRNWKYLDTWAKEEFDNYSISIDFEKQLERWVSSNKANGFLLSIGPLTYFESWYNRVNPNRWWIARYLPENIDQNKKLEKAEGVLNNAREFIKRSASKHLVTRAIMRYGPKRIAAVLALIGSLTLSSFVVTNYFQRQNASILKDMTEQSFQLANSSKINFYDKSVLLIEQLKSGATTIDEIIDRIDDPLGRREPQKEILQTLTVSEDLLRKYPLKKANPQQLSSLVKDANYLRNVIGLACVYNPSNELLTIRNKVAEYSAILVKHILTVQPTGFKEINQLNAALENAINYKAFTTSDLAWLLQILSPFENEKRTDWVVNNYAKDKLADRSSRDYGFKFNGLYQELAYLYAASGNVGKTLQCVDSLLTYNQNYYQNDYTAMLDNATNIAAVLHAYALDKELDEFVKKYCTKKGMTEVEFYQRFIARSHVYDPVPQGLNEFGGGTLINLNCQLSDDKTLMFLFERYRVALNASIKNSDEQHYLLALSYKDEAILRFNLLHVKGEDHKKEPLVSLFDKAFEHYKKVNPKYLMEEIMAATFSDNDAKLTPRKFLFLYPDYRITFAPFEPRDFFAGYTSVFFIDYLVQNNLIEAFYKDEDIRYFSTWLESILFEQDFIFNGANSIRLAPDWQGMVKLEKAFASRNSANTVDLNLLYLHLGNEAMKNKNKDSIHYYYDKIDKDKISNLLGNPLFWIKMGTFVKIANMLTNLCMMDSLPKAYSFVQIFKDPINRSSLYAFAALKLAEQKINKPMVQRLLDSSRMEFARIEYQTGGRPNRQTLVYALAMQAPEANSPLADSIIKNIGNKFEPTLRIARSFAFHSDLYGSQQQTVSNISDDDQARFLWNILYGYAYGNKAMKPEWKEYTNNYIFFQVQLLMYVDENK
jgi:energy-coupling factor transporter ATP-binding protein EcfA2